MESNHKSGDGLTGTQKEAALRALIQRTGYNLIQVGIQSRPFVRSVWLHPEVMCCTGGLSSESLHAKRSLLVLLLLSVFL